MSADTLRSHPPDRLSGAALGSAGLYATTKFAVVGLTEALRTEIYGRPIGVAANY